MSARPSPRARALADRLIHGADALIVLAGNLTDTEWRTRLPARTVAQGRTVTGFVPADIDTMNAAHALDHDGAAKEPTLALLRRNSSEAATAIAQLTDEELDRAAPVSLYGDAPLTCHFVLEDHAVRHSYHHLARIRAALGR